MNRLQKAAVLLTLVKRLRENKSWCGETHIQKAAFFAQEMLGVPLEFDFILYKYGPFSFELSEELTTLRADSILDLEVRSPQYGPSYIPGGMHDFVAQRFPRTIERYRKAVDFVADHLGRLGVSDLERLATALYVRVRSTDDKLLSVEQRSHDIVKLKPHVPLTAAKEAVERVDQMVLDWSESCVAS